MFYYFIRRFFGTTNMQCHSGGCLLSLKMIGNSHHFGTANFTGKFCTSGVYRHTWIDLPRKGRFKGPIAEK